MIGLYDILARHERVGVAGYPDVGKTTVAQTIDDRPRWNTGHQGTGGDGDTPTDIGVGNLAEYWVGRLAGEPRFALDGVFVPRVARRSVRDGPIVLDAVVWVEPHSRWHPDARRRGFRRSIDTVWDEFRWLNQDRGGPIQVYMAGSAELLGGELTGAE